MPAQLKVTCVVDNLVRGAGLWGEHGLAWLVETEAGRLLFDTGQSGTVLMHNLERLGVEPVSLDALALSHGHFDHTGGLGALLPAISPGIPLYAHPDFTADRFIVRPEETRSIGMSHPPAMIAERTTTHLGDEPQEILPGVWTTGEIRERPEPEGRGSHHSVPSGAGWAPDPYRDDLALAVDLGGEMAVILGCGHAGLLNTVAHVEQTWGRPVVAVAGGAHLGETDTAGLEHVIAALRERPRLKRLFLNHCTGDRATAVLINELGAERARVCPAGAVLTAAVLHGDS